MRKTLYLLCGLPGSGKTTWAVWDRGWNHKFEETIQVSRDQIRFSLLEEDDAYFSHERQTYKIYVNTIQEAINDDIHKFIYADATHLNETSRNKLLNKLILDNVDIIVVNFLTNIDECILRDSHRTGREHAGEDTILDMWEIFEPATKNEKYKYKKIITVRE